LEYAGVRDGGVAREGIDSSMSPEIALGDLLGENTQRLDNTSASHFSAYQNAIQKTGLCEDFS
jgi:hypothetical protein